MSAGNFDATRERLAHLERLQEERAQARRQSMLAALTFVVTVCVTLISWLLLDGP